MSFNTEGVSSYVVNIKNQEGQGFGSGVIVKLSKEKSFALVFSVRHIFNSLILPDAAGRIGGESRVDRVDISAYELTLSDSIDEKIDKKNGFAYLSSCEKTDLAVIPIAYSAYIDRLKPLSIYNLELKDIASKVFYIAGFSYHDYINNKEREVRFYKSNLHLFDERRGDTVRLENKSGPIVAMSKSKIKGMLDLVNGMSGGGVFIEKYGQAQLVGIQKSVEEPSIFRATFLGAIYESIVEITYLIRGELNPSEGEHVSSQEILPFDNSILLDGADIDVFDINLEGLEERFKVNSYEGSAKEFKVAEVDAALEQQFRSSGDLKKCAATYVRYALLCRKEGSFRKATNYLNRAISLDSGLEPILIFERSKKSLGSKSKKNRVHKALIKSLRYRLNFQSLPLKERVDSIKKIIHSYEAIGGSEDQVLNYSKDILSLLHVENNEHGAASDLDSYKKKIEVIVKSWEDDWRISREGRFSLLGDIYSDAGCVDDAYKAFYMAKGIIEAKGGEDNEAFENVADKIGKLTKFGHVLSTEKTVEYEQRAQVEVDELFRKYSDNRPLYMLADLVDKIKYLLNDVENKVDQIFEMKCQIFFQQAKPEETKLPGPLTRPTMKVVGFFGKFYFRQHWRFLIVWLLPPIMMYILTVYDKA